MPVVTLLKANPCFAKLSPEHLEALDAALMVSSHPDGHVLAKQGERGGDLFLVVSGKVEVSRVHEHERRVLATLGPGEFFGLISLVDHSPRSATCVAEGPVEIATLSHAAANFLFHAQAPVACAFQHALAQQLALDFRRIDARLRELYRRASMRPS